MIKVIVRFANGMVVVFDKRGEQLPGYQGQYDEVRAAVLADAPAEAVFAHAFTDTDGFRELQRVPREQW